MTWRPIETAPKDGTAILLWVPDVEGGPIIDVGCYKEDNNNGPFGPFCWRGAQDESGGWARDVVTHWQPLPSPPTESDEDVSSARERSNDDGNNSGGGNSVRDNSSSDTNVHVAPPAPGEFTKEPKGKATLSILGDGCSPRTEPSKATEPKSPDLAAAPLIPPPAPGEELEPPTYDKRCLWCGREIALAKFIPGPGLDVTKALAEGKTIVCYGGGGSGGKDEIVVEGGGVEIPTLQAGGEWEDLSTGGWDGKRPDNVRELLGGGDLPSAGDPAVAPPAPGEDGDDFGNKFAKAMRKMPPTPALQEMIDSHPSPDNAKLRSEPVPNSEWTHLRTVGDKSLWQHDDGRCEWFTLKSISKDVKPSNVHSKQHYPSPDNAKLSASPKRIPAWIWGCMLLS